MELVKICIPIYWITSITCNNISVQDRVKRIFHIYKTNPMMKLESCIELINHCIFLNSCKNVYFDVSTGHCQYETGDEELYNKAKEGGQIDFKGTEFSTTATTSEKLKTTNMESLTTKEEMTSTNIETEKLEIKSAATSTIKSTTKESLTTEKLETTSAASSTIKPITKENLTTAKLKTTSDGTTISKAATTESLTTDNQVPTLVTISTHQKQNCTPNSASESHLLCKYLCNGTCLTADDEEVENLAFGSDTKMSSLFYDWFAYKGVDGLYSLIYDDRSSNFHTNQELNPWWYVELQSKALIIEIRIINRFSEQDRIKKLSISISNSTDFSSNSNIAVNQNMDGILVRRFNCTMEYPIAQYVQVMNVMTGYLHLQEVEVYGKYLS